MDYYLEFKIKFSDDFLNKFVMHFSLFFCDIMIVESKI